MEPYTHQGEENTLNKEKKYEPAWLKYLIISPHRGLISYTIQSIAFRNIMRWEEVRHLTDCGLPMTFCEPLSMNKCPMDGRKAILSIFNEMSAMHNAEKDTVAFSMSEVREAVNELSIVLYGSRKARKVLITAAIVATIVTGIAMQLMFIVEIVRATASF